MQGLHSEIFIRLHRGCTRRAGLLLLASALVSGLSGCLKHTRLLERPQKPEIVLSSGAAQLVASLDERYDAIHSITATVMIRASVGGASKGKITDYTALRGYILLRQPDMLRVLGMLPVVETRAFDMASNGKNFTLLIPPKSEAIVGSGVVTTPSPNPLMNLRPAVFFDSMLVGKVEPSDFTYVTSDTRIVGSESRLPPLPHTKRVIEEPDYELGILRRVGTSQQLLPERVIHISRTNLLPYQQDEYDNQGILVTRTFYSDYQTFDQIPYPTHIVISRPIDGYRIDLTIEKLALNRPISDNQFELKIPAGTRIKHLP